MDALFGNSNNGNTGTGPPSTTFSGTTSSGTTSEGKCECASYQDSITKTPCTPKKAWYSLWGGRKRNCSMKRGGSFRPSSDLITAAPFSRGRTAQSHNWTGGRRRRRSSKRRTMRFKCNKCSKRRRHRH
jgi:hypothetical protein